MKLSRKILCGLVIITTVLFAAIIFAPCLKLSNEFKNVVTGVFTSSLVVLIIELISLLHDLVNLSKLKGTYTRKEITNWDQASSEHKDITNDYIESNVNDSITLTYQGEGEYNGTATYKDGTVEITINLEKANPKIGKGIYQYYDKTDLGTYKIQVDRNDINKIYVSYLNVISSNSALSGLAHGYEIWEKKIK